MEYISYSNAIPYLLYLSFLILLVFLEFNQLNLKHGTSWIRKITFLSFVIFFGFKGFIGRDVFFYYDMFKTMPTIWDFNQQTFSNSNIEIGFRMYVVLLKSISNSFVFFTVVGVLIDAVILDIFFRKYSKYYVLSFLIYIVLYGHILEMDQIRNCKSIMIFLLSIPFLKDKKILPYMLMNIIGFSFHFSSLFFIIAYFFVRKNYSIYFYLTVFILGNILFLFKIQYIEYVFTVFKSFLNYDIELKLTSYFASDVYSKAYGLSLGYFERIITYVLVCLLFRDKLIKQNENNVIFINLFVLFFISFFFLSEIVVAVVRVSALFYFSYAIIYPNLFSEFKKILYKQIFMLIFVLYAGIRFVNYHIGIEYKYENVLFNDVNVKNRKEISRKALEHWEKENKK